MQKLYRLSVVILIVSLFLLTAPPARAGHVIAAVSGPNFQLGGAFALTNTGQVYHRRTTWAIIGTVPGAFAFSGFDFEDTNNRDIWLLSVRDGLVFRSLVTDAGIGPLLFLAPACSASSIRSFTITSDANSFVGMTIIHEDGMICVGGSPMTGPAEPVAVEETTWGAVKDTYKFKD